MKKTSRLTTSKILVLTFVFVIGLVVVQGAYAKPAQFDKSECQSMAIKEGIAILGWSQGGDNVDSNDEYIKVESISNFSHSDFDYYFAPGTGTHTIAGTEVFLQYASGTTCPAGFCDSTRAYFKVGDWDYMVWEYIDIYGVWENLYPIDVFPETEVFIRALQKYWAMYEQYGTCSATPTPAENNVIPPLEQDLCAGVSCVVPVCSQDLSTSWDALSCNPSTGLCDLIDNWTRCEQGCDEYSGLCNEEIAGDSDYYYDDNDYYPDDDDYYYDDSESDTDFYYDDSSGFLDILLVGGSIIVIGGGTLGGGYLGYRAIRNRLARRAAKAIRPMPVKSPTPAPAPPKPMPRQMPRKDLERKVNDLSNDIDRLLEKLNKHNPARDDVRFNQRLAKIYERKLGVINKFDYGTRAIKKASDIAADAIGHFPGAGQRFRWGYYGVTEGIMKTIETGSLRKGFYQGFKAAGENYLGDKLTDKVIKFKSIRANGPLKEIGRKSTFRRRIKRGVTRKIIEGSIQIGKKMLKLIWR